MVVGPVAKPSGGGLGTPARNGEQERTNEAGQHEPGLLQFANAVMTGLARRKGTKAAAAFMRAYRFDATRNGWHETPWGSAQVAALYTKLMNRVDHGAVEPAALSRVE